MFHKIARFALALILAAPGLLLAATPVNINQADAATLAKSLDGIGQARAQAIVAWREAHGAFKKVDDLRHVKGFGKATIERNRSAILLADDNSGAADVPASSVNTGTTRATTSAAAAPATE